MNKAKHTPGPWKAHACGDGSTPITATIKKGTEGRIAETYAINKVANARLIAAAPQLLDACYAALSQLTEDRAEYLDSDIAQLQGAIAKAKREA